MAEKFKDIEFEKHISKLIVNKEIYKMLDQLRSIMRKIVFLIGEEDWDNESFTKYQRKQSLELILDYSFIYCVNELITVLNDSGTLAPMPGVKKWIGNYENKYFEYFFNNKELKSNKNNIKLKDKSKFKNTLNKLLTCNNEDDIEKEILKIGEKYNIKRNDMISMRGFTFELEDRILAAIWDEE